MEDNFSPNGKEFEDLNNKQDVPPSSDFGAFTQGPTFDNSAVPSQNEPVQPEPSAPPVSGSQFNQPESFGYNPPPAYGSAPPNFTQPTQQNYAPMSQLQPNFNQPPPPAFSNPDYQQPYNGMPPPPYGAPPFKQPDPAGGMPVASMILGIASLVFMCAYGIGIIAGIVGLILGVLAKKKGSKNGMTTAGIICSIIGIVIGIIFLIIIIAGIISAADNYPFSYGYRYY